MHPTDATRQPDDLETLARRRVARKVGFYIHATVYVLVNLGLIGIDTVSGARHWAHLPLLGWGLGLAIHGIATFAATYGDRLHRRMLDRELDALRRGGIAGQ